MQNRDAGGGVFRRLGGPVLAVIGLLVASSLMVAASRPSVAADTDGEWPHWRGPAATGFVDAEGVPVEWSTEENVCWKVDLPGVSAATPIVTGGRIYLNVGNGDDLELWSLELSSGEVVWKRPLGSGNLETRKQDMSSPSPVTDGDRVVAMTGLGGVRAFDTEGTELWSRDLVADYGEFGMLFGYASSPLLVDGTVYIQVLHGMRTDDPSYVLGLDATTGATRWKVERPTDAQAESPDAYTTPTRLPRGDGWELVISGGDYVTGHDPATGREIWRVDGLNPEDRKNYRIVASPIVVGDRLVVPSRVSPLLVLDTTGEGAPVLAWKLDRGTDVPAPTTDGTSLFVVDDDGRIRRFDLRTGEETWQPQRLSQGNYSGSPVVADGRLYVTNELGVTSVVPVEGEFRVLAENRTPGYVLASPAVVGDRLLLRTDSALWCIDDDRP